MATIVTAVLAAGSILSWLDPARKARWAALVLLAVLGVAYAARRWRSALGLLPLISLAAAFVVLALESALWSGEPRLVVEHAAAFGVLLLACAGTAVGATGRPASVGRLLDAVLVAVGVVGVGGLLVLLFNHDRAVAPATPTVAARYQGLGGGPDTATMVLAIGLPLCVHAFFTRRRPLERAAAAALALVLLGSIVASDSRGALAGGFAGLVIYTAASFRGRRLAALAAVAVVAAVSVALTRLPSPNPHATTPSKAQPTGPPVTHGSNGRSYMNADAYLRMNDDVGHPPPGVGVTVKQPRTLFGTSGRAEAWQGAINQADSRPTAGYGFGREDHVFVDRYVGFDSNEVENSYIGLYLQLGLAGLAFLLAIIGAIAARAVGAFRSSAETRTVAAVTGSVTAGLVLGLFQSFLYAPGNNATAALWLCAFLLAAGAGAREGRSADA